MGKQKQASALSTIGVQNFAELVARRPAIFGEDPGSYEMFQAQLLQTLAPMDAYEYALATELIDISWEIIQARHVKATEMRLTLREKIYDAVKSYFYGQYNRQADAEWAAHIAAGGTEDDWEQTVTYDSPTRSEQAQELAERATALDKLTASQAHAELIEMEIDQSVILHKTYFEYSTRNKLDRLEERQKILERRRRELERDFRRLQDRRPIEGEATEL